MLDFLNLQDKEELAQDSMFQVASFEGVQLTDKTYQSPVGSILAWLNAIKADEDLLPLNPPTIVADLAQASDNTIWPVITAGADSVIWINPVDTDPAFFSKYLGMMLGFAAIGGSGNIKSHTIEIGTFTARPDFNAPAPLTLIKRRTISVRASNSFAGEAWITHVEDQKSAEYNSDILVRELTTVPNQSGVVQPINIGFAGQIKSMAFVFKSVLPTQMSVTGTAWFSGRGMVKSVMNQFFELSE
jgi:hypothetical protein